jgi:hypothetical protein
MAMPRADHTATLLTDGRVLVIDGGQLDIDDLLVSVASAELYDPASGAFTTVASPCLAREQHTATLLKNGKVLITGGNLFNGYPTWLTPTSTAELYDPATGMFAFTGSMTVERSGHTASLLPDGRVLIVGGAEAGAPTAELYDPVSATFTSVPGLTEARSGHTATVLLSGKVLVAGGQAAPSPVPLAGNGQYSPSALVYDPSINAFAPAGNMSTARWLHSATLLPTGMVLIAGGQDGTGRNLQTAELFDPLSGTFSPTASLSTPRVLHTATQLLDGTVLFCGGYKDWVDGFPTYIGYESYDDAEIFDPVTSTFNPVGHMNSTRFAHTATLLHDGSVLIIGGIGNDTVRSSAELFR